MASFETRIELHDANWNDYTRLHKEASSRGFKNVIKSDDGRTFQLPPAEYRFDGTATRSQVLELAKAAASATGKNYGAIVTEAVGSTWHGLSLA